MLKTFPTFNLCLVFTLFFFVKDANAQYKIPTVNNVYAGVFAQAGMNMNMNSVIKNEGRNGTKDGMSPSLKVGVFYEKPIGEFYFIKSAISTGVSMYSLKYHPSFTSSTDTSWEEFASSYTGINNTVIPINIEIGVGRYFKVGKKGYLNVALGAAASAFLNKKDYSSDTTTTHSKIKYVGDVDLSSYYHSQFGNSGNSFMGDAFLYVGFRPFDLSNLPLSRFNIGLQLQQTIYNKQSGKNIVEYYNDTYNYRLGRSESRFTNSLIMLSMSYSLI